MALVSPGGPSHYGAPCPRAHRGAVGLARRPTNAGQHQLERSQRRGINSHDPAPRKLGQAVRVGSEGQTGVAGHATSRAAVGTVRRGLRTVAAVRSKPKAVPWPGWRAAVMRCRETVRSVIQPMSSSSWNTRRSCSLGTADHRVPSRFNIRDGTRSGQVRLAALIGRRASCTAIGGHRREVPSRKLKVRSRGR